MELETFDDVIASIQKKKNKRQFHLLLGNGFSMSYDNKIFSYNALHDFVSKSGSGLLTELFETIKTKNFEEVVIPPFCEGARSRDFKRPWPTAVLA